VRAFENVAKAVAVERIENALSSMTPSEHAPESHCAF
jgi:hypothetical protein